MLTLSPASNPEGGADRLKPRTPVVPLGSPGQNLAHTCLIVIASVCAEMRTRADGFCDHVFVASYAGLATGTLSNRLSALTLLVQASSIHNTTALDSLRAMAQRGRAKGGRDEGLKAVRCVVDWCVGGGGPGRKLKYVALLQCALGPATHVLNTPPDTSDTSPSYIRTWMTRTFSYGTSQTGSRNSSLCKSSRRSPLTLSPTSARNARLPRHIATRTVRTGAESAAPPLNKLVRTRTPLHAQRACMRSH